MYVTYATLRAAKVNVNYTRSFLFSTFCYWLDFFLLKIDYNQCLPFQQMPLNSIFGFVGIFFHRSFDFQIKWNFIVDSFFFSKEKFKSQYARQIQRVVCQSGVANCECSRSVEPKIRRRYTPASLP